MVQWLGCGTFTAIAWVQPLVGEIRSHKPLSTAQKNKTKQQRDNTTMSRAQIQNTDTNAGKDVETGTLNYSEWKCKTAQPLCKSLAVSYKTKCYPYHTSQQPCFLRFYPKELKTGLHKKLRAEQLCS